MSFPLSPVNGQAYTNALGTKYVYDSTRTAWNISYVSSTTSRSFMISYPTATSDSPLWRAPVAITITAAHLLTMDGTNVIGSLWEYDSNGAGGSAVHTDATSTTSNVDVTSFSNPIIDASNYLGWKTTSVSGEVSRTLITFEYTTP